MAGNYRFEMDQKDIIKLLITTIGSFIQDRLTNKQQRLHHKEQCAERLAAEDGSCDKEEVVRYSDQAVLANLDWGIEALEEAINTSNVETKLARLDYAEKMLQVCAMLDSNQKTAGVPNFYLSAWAHLNLAYLWKLRNDIQSSVFHILEMFYVDPFFSRIDFAPELWKDMFLPQMSSIVGWYSESRHRLVMEVIPDSSDLSLTGDFNQYFNESLILSMTPDQVEKLQKLEQMYGESLDENTKLFAKYYKDCLKAADSSPTIGKKTVPMLPIAEPPMTPLHEVSKSIPDYVKFGPILPKSAGFSPVLKSKDRAKQATSSLKPTSSGHSHDYEDDELLEEKRDFSDYGTYHDNNEEEEEENHDLKSIERLKTLEAERTSARSSVSKSNSRGFSPKIFSPVDSPYKISSKSSSPKTDSRKKPASTLRLLSRRFADSPTSNDHSICSADSDGEVPALFELKTILNDEQAPMQVLENSPLHEADEGNQSSVSLSASEKMSIRRSRPPKDFVCPITGQIFNDPVTLETGQTYERKAIQEWIKRGNTSCPITRQQLSTNALPKTNYVLKRLITTWREQYPDLAQEFSYSETPRHSFNSPSAKETALSRATFNISDNQKSPEDYIKQRSRRFVQASAAMSPTSVLSQGAVEAIINGLKPHVSCICTSENLQECEAAVLGIARLWKEAKGDQGIHSYLSKPTIINGFVEILFASLNRDVLRTSISVLSELLLSDESVGEILTNVDSDLDCLATLLKNGLADASVLIYQLRPAFAKLSAHDLIPSLVHIIINQNEEELDDLRFVMEPKDAAIALLEHILIGGDDNSRSLNALRVISENGVPALVKCLDVVEVRRSVVSILLCCINADKKCRDLIASRIELSPVLEVFHSGNDSVRGICIEFLSELVQLHRRTCCNTILQTIRDEGAFSTMHTFLVYLQMAPMEQQPVIASLLLQLDLQDVPRKMSIYREEAIDALMEALSKKDFPHSQMKALDALISLSGRLTLSGKSYTEAWLLKVAGFDRPYNALMNAENQGKQGNELADTTEEEEKAASSWEKNVAFVLCNHEKGSIFKALEECFKSSSLEIAKLSLITATWLTHMLSALPDTGIRSVARKSLLDEFINVLQSSKNQEEKILSTLALKSFIKDPSALQELVKYAKPICKTLRKLKRNSSAVNDILKALMNLSSVDAAELWNCSEVAEIDVSQNGEILALVHLKGRILSSHADGTIRVWDLTKKVLRLIQEVREHTKAVTGLCISPSGTKLFSGSLDKTIRIWTIKPEGIHCVQVHDVKEAIYELTANSKFACFTTQATGVKVYNWSDVPRHINFSKHVKCLAMAGDRLFCGCSGYSIQEVDLSTFRSQTFYSGTRKLLGKQTMHSLCIQEGLLYAGGSVIDGAAGKVFSISTKASIGSFVTGFDIQYIAINNDFIFTGTRNGIIEIWLKERVSRIAAVQQMGSGSSSGHAKITTLVADMDNGMFFAGSTSGKIQVWSLD